MIDSILGALLQKETIPLVLLEHVIGNGFVFLGIHHLEIIVLTHREEVMHQILSDLNAALGMLQGFLMLVELTQQCADLHVDFALIFQLLKLPRGVSGEFGKQESRVQLR